MLPPWAARETLPLVCSSWASLLRRPLPLWSGLDLNFALESGACTGGADCALHAPPALDCARGPLPPPPRRVRAARVLAWAAARGASVRRLRVRGAAGGGPSKFPPPGGAADPHGAAPPAAPAPPLHDFTPADLGALVACIAPGATAVAIERCADLVGPPLWAALSRAPRLRSLVVKGVRAPMVEEDVRSLESLVGLEELVLDCDQPPDAGDGEPEARWGLPRFPDGLSRLTKLTHVTLSCHYGITSLPGGVSALRSLAVLNLDFCTLSHLPPTLGLCAALTSLDVEGNVYLGDAFRRGPGGGGGAAADPGAAALPPAFPPELAGLSALRYINLNSCGLRALPAVLTSCAALETVDLEDNDLGDALAPHYGLPPSMARLTRLQCLNIAQCKLPAVPPAVEGLVGLRILDVTNNRVTDAGVPMGLARLPHLKAVGLKKNALTVVPAALAACGSLQEIYLEDNADLEITAPLDAVAALPHLRVVMLGKQWGGWSPRSLAHVAAFAAALKVAHPSRDVLRISYPGAAPPPPVDGEEGLEGGAGDAL
jgi:hypothetical protein